MDARHRLTAFDEFEIGKTYLWKKGTSYKGPCRCVDLDRKRHFVIMEEKGERLYYSPHCWPNRFIDAGIAMGELAMFPDLKGSIPIDVLDKRLKKHFEENRLKGIRRHPGQGCGNCDFFDTGILLCFNVNNMTGGNCQQVHFNSWCPHWTKSTGF